MCLSMKEKFVHFEGAMALLGGAVIYGTFGVLVRELAKMMGDAMQTLARFALAAAIITVINLLIRRRYRIPRPALLRAALLGVLFSAEIVLFTISANNTKIANAVVLLYAGSILSSFIIGTLAFREKITTQKMVAIGLALIGLSMYSGGFLAASLGILAGFGSGLIDGLSNATRKTLKSVDRNLVIMYQFLAGSIFALIVVTLAGDFTIVNAGWLPIIATVIFAVAQIVLNNLLLFGFQHFDVNIGTVILATELFFATIMGYLFFRESPTIAELIGGIVIFMASIVASVNLAQLFRRRQTGSSKA
jgi:drug/metabolite transporter (DMT)-like permease